MDQPRDIRDVLRMRREPLVERGLCGFGVNDHPADFFILAPPSDSFPMLASNPSQKIQRSCP